MIELLNSLSPQQQAMVAGVAVSVVMYAGRFLARAWFADESKAAEFQKRMLSIALAGFAAITLCVGEGGCATQELLLSWAICWLTAQGAHNLAKTRLRD